MNHRKIVLVHDSFTQAGGAERVVCAFHEFFPSAPVYGLVADEHIYKDMGIEKVHTSFLQFFYYFLKNFKYYLPLLPLGTLSFRLPKNSLILSSSSLFLKALRKPKGSYHIQYCHTPPRFIWTDPEYVEQEVPAFLRPIVWPLLGLLRSWDKRAAKKVDKFIANSHEVQGRIKAFYNRDSVVIYPFVDINFWQPTKPKKTFFLMGGRLQEHKNYEAVIKAFQGTNLELIVFGTGRFETELKKISPANAKFLGRVTDEQLRDLYSEATALIYPSIEDAGIMPLEASACGTPTLAVKKGGALETVIEATTGEFVENPTANEIQTQILNWNSGKYEQAKLLEHAKKFSKERFQQEILSTISITNSLIL